jgi:hypothetical protein
MSVCILIYHTLNYNFHELLFNELVNKWIKKIRIRIINKIIN